MNEPAALIGDTPQNDRYLGVLSTCDPLTRSDIQPASSASLSVDPRWSRSPSSLEHGVIRKSRVDRRIVGQGPRRLVERRDGEAAETSEQFGVIGRASRTLHG